MVESDYYTFEDINTGILRDDFDFSNPAEKKKKITRE